MRRYTTIGGFVAIWIIYLFAKLPSSDDLSPNSSISVLLPIGAMMIWYFLNWIQIVNEWNRRPLMRFGRYVRTLNPGITLIEPFINRTLRDISIQDIVVKVTGVGIQTKDNIGISLTGALTYRISEDRVRDAVVNVDDVHDAIVARALSTMNDLASVEDLDHLLHNRAAFCKKIADELSTRVQDWGPQVKAFELRDFKINDENLAEAIAMKARARKEGEAELERAKLQEEIAVTLNQAAETYSEKGRWLKGMETLLEMCRSATNNTILVPTDALEGLAKLVPNGKK